MSVKLGPGSRVLVGVLLVVGVATAIVAVIGWQPFSQGGPDTPNQSTAEVPHNNTYVRSAEPGATALILKVSADEEREVEIHWTNFGRWNGTRVTLSKNVRLHDTDRQAVLLAGVSGVRTTSCHGDQGSTVDLSWGIRSCPKRPVIRDANFTTEGTLGPGTEWWYLAAYGADESIIGVEIHADGPVRILSAESARTRLVALPENRTMEGLPEGGTAFRAQRNLSTSVPSYGVFMIAGEWEEKPDFEARGAGRHYRFSPAFPTYQNRTGSQVWVPAFPAPGGDYTINVEGGRRSAEPDQGEVAGLALGQILEPGFVTDDGWLAQP